MSECLFWRESWRWKRTNDDTRLIHCHWCKWTARGCQENTSITSKREREWGTNIMSAKGTPKERETREGARCARPSGGVDCIGMHLAGQWENVCNLTSIVWQIGLHLLNQLKHPLLDTHTYTLKYRETGPSMQGHYFPQLSLAQDCMMQILHWTSSGNS